MSSSTNNEISSVDSHKSSSTTVLSKFSLNLLIRYIENVLSAIANQGLDCTIFQCGTELRDLVQPVASDFSKLFEGISDGAKMFSDQIFSKSRLSTEAHSMAVDVLKGLGNAHWVAGGLLAIANVLERFENISANDRECIDLLRAMLKLGKYLKQMKDLNVNLEKDIVEDMCEAVQLIVSAAILCRSFITSSKLSKFLLTKKIRDELVYVRGKVNNMKADLMGHTQLLIMKTLTFIHEQYITGRTEENSNLGITEQYQSMDTQCEMVQSCTIELDGQESDNLSSERSNISDGIDGYKQLNVDIPLRSSFQLGRFLRKIIPTIVNCRLKFPLHLESQILVKEIHPSPTIVNCRLKFPLHLESQILVKEIHPSAIEFKFDELNKATKGFSQKIGAGSFGFVYSGILPDGRQVAVKMLRNTSPEGKKEWMNELGALTKIHHRNIIELVGYCSDGGMMLVYDYMPRNLDTVIWGEDEIIIDWPTRRRIIMDIIRGLSYLHEGPDGCIVHRDIKPSNILLDENLNAKISDFGVAQMSPFSSYETSIVGTPGYLDPEYVDTCCVTVMSDIYGFGVLVLNVVSGKRAILHTKDAMYYLVSEAWRLHKRHLLTKLIDPRLLNMDGLIHSSSILRMIKVALRCLQMGSTSRPSASQVLGMLSSNYEIPIPTLD